ncbi:MAG: cell wall hydrolase [Caulobacteraceae bacterium]
MTFSSASAASPPDDVSWLALCVWDEARGEVCLGQAAVAQVVLNRAARKYASDGTVKGAILGRFQFSGFWFAMENGHYTQISGDQADAEHEAAILYAQAQKDRAWASCLIVARTVLAKSYTSPMPQWAALRSEPNTVLYYNPAICGRPGWASPSREVCVIGHHTFFRSA